MKKNGFTLIELLAVLVILAILAIITTVSVNTYLKDSKDSLSSVQKTKLLSAAETFYLKEGMNNNRTCVNISELIEKDYIEGSVVKDPKDKKDLTGSIQITTNSNKYSYTYQENGCSGCKLETQNPGKYSVGDIVTCELSKSTEQFYVIEDENTDETPGIDILAKYSLNVGYEYKENPVLGMPGEFIPLKNPTGYQASPGLVTGPTRYSENENHIINYVEYLNEKMPGATGKLMSLEQAIGLGCNLDQYSCENAPEWLNTSNFWSSTKTDSCWDGNCYYTLGGFIGNCQEDDIMVAPILRPVITVTQNDIYYY